MSNIIDIHIQRNAAGVQIPFDKVYLIRSDDKDLVPKIFGYGLVLPLTDEIKAALYTLRPASMTRKHFRRNDEHKAMPVKIDDKLVTNLGISKTDIEDWWQKFGDEIDLGKRLVVIPILTSTARRKIRPRYMANQKWFGLLNQQTIKRRKRLPVYGTDIVQPISDYAYLATPLKAPNDKIRPLCSICPRMMQHIQGDCVPGQLVCYTALNFSDIAGDTGNVSVQSDND